MAAPDLARETRLRRDAEALGAALPPLLVEAERVAATVAQGVHGRRRVGVGESFWQYRHAQPGDPLTAIDWRQSARSERVYVRENEWEAAETVWFWRDASASMEFQSDWGATPKADRADLIALALAALLTRAGERVALMGGPRDEGLAPSAGRQAVERMAELLSTRADDPADAPPLTRTPRHARLVLIGDFLGELDALREAVAWHSGRHVRGHLMQVLDPAEEDLPHEGRTEFRDVESDARLVIERPERLRAAYAEALAAHRQAIAHIARAHGWSFQTHVTSARPEAALLALYATLSAQPEMTL